MSSLSQVAGTVVVRSMDQAMRTYEAMTLRGYHETYPFAPLPKMGNLDCAVMVGVPLFALLAFLSTHL